MTIQTLYPNIKPTLNLDFANTEKLDGRITFTRASAARYYDGKTVAKAEENLFTYSQEFNNAAWQKEGSTVTANSIAAPDGTTTADTLIANAVAGFHRILSASYSLASAEYVTSVFAKKGTADWLLIREGLDGTTVNSSFNLNTGTLGVVGAGRTATIVESPVGSGWYRCTTKVTAVAGSRIVTFCVATADNTQSYTAAGTESIYLWGAQLEQRSAVTAYTATTTQPITNYIPVLLTATDNVARFDHNPTTGESLGLLVEEQRTNLVLRSEEFSNAVWTKFRASISPNTIVAPDGTLTGDKLIEDTTANNTHGVYAQNYAATNVTLTASVYVKAAERTFVTLEISNFLNATAMCTFNLTNGTSGVASGGGDYSNISSSITSVGNGWYRCSLTATKGTANSSNYFTIDINNGTTISYTGDGYSGIYLWGAQLEVGEFPTSYIPTVASQVTRSSDAASMTGANFSSWYRQDEGTLYAEYLIPSLLAGTVASIDDGTANNRWQIRYTTTGLTGGRYRFVSPSGSFDAVDTVVKPLANTFNKVAYVAKIGDQVFVINSVVSSLVQTQSIMPVVDRLQIGNGPATDAAKQLTIKRLAFYPLRPTNAQLQAITG